MNNAGIHLDGRKSPAEQEGWRGLRPEREVGGTLANARLSPWGCCWRRAVEVTGGLGRSNAISLLHLPSAGDLSGIPFSLERRDGKELQFFGREAV